MLSSFTTLGLGVIVMAASIAGMIAVLRGSAWLPYVATITGALGIFFFSTAGVLATPGILVSLLAIGLGTVKAGVHRRSTRAMHRLVPLDELQPGDYLSESGHWRRAS